MSPHTTNESPSFDDVRRALQFESPAPEKAAEEAAADPSVHLEVKKEGARGSGTRVQPPAPEFPDAADMAAHHRDALAVNPLDLTDLADTLMHAATTLDIDLLRALLEPCSNKRRPRGSAGLILRAGLVTLGPRDPVVQRARQNSRPSSRP